jgi:hypothetical protein
VPPCTIILRKGNTVMPTFAVRRPRQNGHRRFHLTPAAFFAVGFLLLLLVPATGRAQVTDTTKVDSLLLHELERQMTPPAPPAAAEAPAQPRSAISTNPNMSVIGDFQGSYQSDIRRKLDAYLNEAEISIQSVVDPYARADFFVSLGRDPATGTFGADLEEGYVTSTDLPAGLQVKAGKFRGMFGRLNAVHPHALPFIDMPNVYANYLGEEGLNDAGLSVSWLVPNPLDFYQELTFEATGGPSDNPSFARSPASRYLYLAHLKNFWDLTENATLELGLTGASGPNAFEQTTTLGSVDLTYKWKPLQFNTYQSFVWQTEALLAHVGTGTPEDVRSWGMYSAMTYQLDKRYFLTGRVDYANLPTDASAAERALSATLGWYATEFQKIELEGKTTTSNVRDQFSQLWLRWVFVIGAHGAHAY